MTARRLVTVPSVGAAGAAFGALVALHPAFAALAAGGLLLASAALLAPALGIALYAAGNAVTVTTLPFGGLAVAPETLFLGFLLLVAAARGGGPDARPGDAWRRVRVPALVAGGFALVACLASLRGGVDANERAILLHAPVWAANAVAVPLLCTRRRELRLLFGSVAATGAILAIACLAFPALMRNGQEAAHLADYRNPLAHFLGLALVVSFALLLAGAGATRAWAAAAGLVLLAAVVDAGSRGGWIAAAAGIVAVVGSRARRFAPRGAVFGVLLAATLGGIAAASAPAVRERAAAAADRFDTIFDWNRRTSNRYRGHVAVAALRIAADEPLLGAGPGGFREAARSRARGLPSLHRGVRSTDNEYARTVGETGLAGLAVLVGGGLVAFFALRRRLAAATDAVAALAPAAGVGLLVHTAAVGAFEDLAYAASFWFLLGTAWACANAEESP